MRSFQLTDSKLRLFTNQIELLPLERLSSWYLEAYADPTRPNTLKAKRLDLESLRHFFFEERGIHFHKLLLSDLTEAILTSWVEWLLNELSPSTVNRRMATIKHFCRVIKERAPFWHNPALGLKDIPTEAEYRGVPEEYQEALIRAAYHLWEDKRPGVRFYRARAGLMVEIALLCGLRASEILGLTPHHISRDARYFMQVRCKGRVYRDVYVPESLQASLQVYLPFVDDVLAAHYPAYAKMSEAERRKQPLFPTLSREQPLPQWLNYKAIWDVFSLASEAIGVGHFSPHTARHAYARRLMDHTKDVTAVADALGHSNINTSFRYLKSSRTAKESAIEGAMRRKA